MRLVEVLGWVVDEDIGGVALIISRDSKHSKGRVCDLVNSCSIVYPYYLPLWYQMAQ